MKAVVLLLSLIAFSRAFLCSGGQKWCHTRITQAAGQQLRASEPFFAGLTNDKIDSLVNWNCATDTDLDTLSTNKPEFHWMQNSFADSRNVMNNLWNQIIQTGSGVSVDAGRKAMGRAIHVLQDFYSHTNWANIKGSQHFEMFDHMIGSGSWPIPLCTDRPCPKENGYKPRTDCLTGGYCKGILDGSCFSSRQKEQCFHSVLLIACACGADRPAIDKDYQSNAYHEEAGLGATAHTVEFLKTLSLVAPNAVKAIFGL